MTLKQSETEVFDEESLEFYVHDDNNRLYTAITEYRIIAISEQHIKDLEVFKDPIVHACITSKFILAVPLDSNVISVYNTSDASPVTTASFSGAEVHSISSLTDDLFVINFWNES